MAWWSPLREGVARLLGGAEPAPAKAAPQMEIPPTPRPDPAWPDLPSVQRALREPLAPVVALDAFTDNLTTWRNPSFLGTLGHQVDPSRGGLVDGLADVRPGNPQPYGSPADMSVRPAAGPATTRPAVQRLSGSFLSAALDVVPLERRTLLAEPSEPAEPAEPAASADATDAGHAVRLVEAAGASKASPAVQRQPELRPEIQREVDQGLPVVSRRVDGASTARRPDGDVEQRQPRLGSESESAAEPAAESAAESGAVQRHTADGDLAGATRPPAPPEENGGASSDGLSDSQFEARDAPTPHESLTPGSEQHHTSGATESVSPLTSAAAPLAVAALLTQPTGQAGAAQRAGSELAVAPVSQPTAGVDAPLEPGRLVQRSLADSKPDPQVPERRLRAVPEPPAARPAAPLLPRLELPVLRLVEPGPTGPHPPAPAFAGLPPSADPPVDPPADPPAESPVDPPVDPPAGSPVEPIEQAPLSGFAAAIASLNGFPDERAEDARLGSPEPAAAATLSAALLPPVAPPGQRLVGEELTMPVESGLVPSGAFASGPDLTTLPTLPVSESDRSVATRAQPTGGNPVGLLGRTPLVQRRELSGSAAQPVPSAQPVLSAQPVSSVQPPERPVASPAPLDQPFMASLGRSVPAPLAFSSDRPSRPDEYEVPGQVNPPGLARDTGQTDAYDGVLRLDVVEPEPAGELGMEHQRSHPSVQRTAAVGPLAPGGTGSRDASQRFAQVSSGSGSSGQPVSYATMFGGFSSSDAEDGFTSVQLASEDTPPPAPAPEPVPVPSSSPAPTPAAAPATSGTAPTDLDEMARRLFEPLSARLRAELSLDRERAGLVADVRP